MDLFGCNLTKKAKYIRNAHFYNINACLFNLRNLSFPGFEFIKINILFFVQVMLFEYHIKSVLDSFYNAITYLCRLMP